MIRLACACLLLSGTLHAQDIDAPFAPPPKIETAAPEATEAPAQAADIRQDETAKTATDAGALPMKSNEEGGNDDKIETPPSSTATANQVPEPLPEPAAIDAQAETAANTGLVPPQAENAVESVPPNIIAAHVQEPPPPEDGRKTGADLFARLTARLSQPACPEVEAVARLRKRYAGHPGSFARHLSEILPLLDFVSREVEASGLPAEFAFIPIVESWYRPDAIGVGGPAGMWQMIASTARNHGIHIQAGYDGRLSPVESTRAALSYLKTLHGMFGGDWQAAVMAYNAGEYRLLKALRQQGSREVSATARKPRGLSAITYDYVAKLQALSCLLAEPGRNGLALPVEARFRVLAPVLVDRNANSLDRVAAGHGVDAAALRRLNPGYRQGRIVAGVPRLVLMPDPARTARPAAATVPGAENDPALPAVATEANAAAVDGLHEVRNGDTLWSIARRYGLGLDQLRRLNGLGRGNTIRAGQRLRVLP